MSPTGFSLTGPRGGLRPSATPLSSPRLGDRGAPPGTTALERCARGAPQEQPRTVGVGVLSHSHQEAHIRGRSRLGDGSDVCLRQVPARDSATLAAPGSLIFCAPET